MRHTTKRCIRAAASAALSTVFAATLVSSASAEPAKDKYLYLSGSTPHFFVPVTAVEKGFCKEMGLNVEVKKFTSGGVAAQSFIAGQGDFLDSGDWPAMRSWMLTEDKEDPIVGMAQDANYRDLSVVMSRAEITDGEQLRGKKIGVWLGTTSEFFAALFLDAHGIGLDEVEFVNVKPAEMVSALDRGDLDAYVIWQPFGWKSMEVSGDKVRELSTGDGLLHRVRPGVDPQVPARRRSRCRQGIDRVHAARRRVRGQQPERSGRGGRQLLQGSDRDGADDDGRDDPAAEQYRADAG